MSGVKVAWGQEGDPYRKEGWSVYDSTWYGGIGSKERMQSEANLKGLSVQLAVEEPVEGCRGYMAYPDWKSASDAIYDMPDNKRHASEILRLGKPCKGYGDLDNNDPATLPESLNTYEKIVARADNAIAKVYKKYYDTQLTPCRDILWMVSPNQTKMSLHYVVDTESPQYVFENNSEDNGAGHLAASIAEFDKELFDSLVDMNVYDKDRGIRLAACSKFKKPHSISEPFRIPQEALYTRTVISCVRADHITINVPMSPEKVQAQIRKSRARPVRVRSQTESNESDVVEKMLVLLQGFHPSAYYEPIHGNEDAYDMLKGVKFNFSDRTEKCHTGHLHEGCNNLCCWVDEGDTVWLRCFSHKCKGQFKRLGLLHEEDRFSEFSEEAVKINTEFLLDKKTNQPEPVLKSVIDRWLDGSFKCLNLKSITGSGKTTLIKYIKDRPELENATILYIVHRQSLAFNVSKTLGFTNYLDINDGRLTDRENYPEVTCQIDSIHKTAEQSYMVPKFDMVILDESESLLHHFSATTLQDPIFTMEKLRYILQSCKWVLSADALLASETCEVIKKFNISQQLIINEWRTSEPRTYEFIHNWSSVVIGILEDVKAGLNVNIVSMSTEKLNTIKEAFETVFPKTQMLIHTSKTGDDLKRELGDVYELWVKPCVGASPTIEAGVDFNRPHFDKQYGIACLMSTTAAGFWQMLWRVRKLRNSKVIVYAAQGIRLGPGSKSKITVSECIDNIRFMRNKAAINCEKEVISDANGGLIMVPKLTPFMLASAHNEARKHNSASRFYHEFVDIAESQGHRVNYIDITEEERDMQHNQGKSTGLNATSLINTELIDEQTAEDIQLRINQCRATEEDKWKSYKYKYMASWGIDAIDEDFVKQMGTNISNPTVKTLMYYLWERASFRDFELPDQCRRKLHCRILREVLAAMQWEHPFDSNKWTPAEIAIPALLKTEMFQNYEQYIKIFSMKAAMKKEWDHKEVLETLNVIFGVFGLSVISRATRKQKDKVRTRTYCYALDPAKTTWMAALINLRTRLATPADNEKANAFLQKTEYGPFSKYVHSPQVRCPL